MAQDKGLEEYRPLLIKNAARLGITPTDATEAVILQAYTDNKSHVTYIYLQQTYQQIKVYNTIISAAFIDGSLQYASGSFVKNITGKAGAPVSSRSYMDAIHGAMRHLHLNEQLPLTAANDLFAVTFYRRLPVIKSKVIARFKLNCLRRPVLHRPPTRLSHTLTKALIMHRLPMT